MSNETEIGHKSVRPDKDATTSMLWSDMNYRCKRLSKILQNKNQVTEPMTARPSRKPFNTNQSRFLNVHYNLRQCIPPPAVQHSQNPVKIGREKRKTKIYD